MRKLKLSISTFISCFFFGESLSHNQFKGDIPNMKIIILMEIVSLLNFGFGFLQFPFTPKYYLGRLLDTVDTVVRDESSISLDGMVPGELCNRECKPNDVKVCRFHFMMKYFQVMGG